MSADAAQPLALERAPIDPPAGERMCGYVRPQTAIGVATHLHGGRVPMASDG